MQTTEGSRPDERKGSLSPLRLFCRPDNGLNSPRWLICVVLMAAALNLVLLAGCDFGEGLVGSSTPTRIPHTSTLPPVSGTEPAPSVSSTATTGPSATADSSASGLVLPVTIAAVPADRPEYDRGNWRHWTDEDGDCQNARQEILIAESRTDVTFQSDEQCRVATGIWEGPYTGTIVDDPGDLDVDHMVPLENTHRFGGWDWSRERKREYANYMGYENHLIATTSGANRSKGAKGPERWRPPLEDYWCVYAVDWVTIKNEWGLTVTEDEYLALSEMLATCDSTVLMQPRQGTPPSPPTPTIPLPLPTDLQYDPFGPDRDCGDFDTYGEALAFFLAAGGPDADPHRLDVNGDGEPCETLPGGPSAIQPQDTNADTATEARQGATQGRNTVAGDDAACAATDPSQAASAVGGHAQADCEPAPALFVPVPLSPVATPVPTPVVTVVPIATPAPTQVAIARTPVPEAAPDVKCSDFSNWPDAQIFYLSSRGPDDDPHGLDADDDGVVCQSLLGAPTTKEAGNAPVATPAIASTPVPEPTPTSPVFVDLPFDPNGPDRNCEDFAFWWDAQNFYLASGGPLSDPHRLDNNSDGTACESLFGAAGNGPERDAIRSDQSSVNEEFEDRNCSDFATWQKANSFFEAEGGPHEDPHGLDRNSDGTPCESLPGAPEDDAGRDRRDLQPASSVQTQSGQTQVEEEEFQDRNCGDFETWQDAQEFFLSEGGPSEDPHRLDGDGNGRACQSLPGAPDG